MTSPSVRVFVGGPSDCGKTQLLWDLFVSKAPRKLTFDFKREVREKWNPDAVTVYTYTELREALGDFAGVPQWHIAYCLDYEEAHELGPRVARLLAHPTTSDAERTYARVIGGLLVDCSEGDCLAPNGSCPPDVRGLVQRGRHEGISVCVATQAPALVDRRFSENAGHLFAFSTQEHTVKQFWQSKTSAHVAEMIDAQDAYCCAWLHKATRTIYWLDASRAPVRVTDYTGRELSAGEPDAPDPAEPTPELAST